MGLRNARWCALVTLTFIGLLCAACDETTSDEPALVENGSDPVENAEPEQEAPAEAAPPQVVDPFKEPNQAFRRKIKKGQTLNPMLRRNGLSPKQALALVAVLKPLINLNSRVRPGDTYHLAVNDEGDVIAFDFTSRRDGTYYVRRQGEELKANKDTAPELIVPGDDPALQQAPVAENRDPGPGSPLVAAPDKDDEASEPVAVVDDAVAIRKDEAPEVARNDDAPEIVKNDAPSDPPDEEAPKDQNKPEEVVEKPPEKGDDKAGDDKKDEVVAEKKADPPMSRRQAAREARKKALKAAEDRRKARKEKAAKEARERAALKKAAEDKALKLKLAAARAEKRARKKREAQEEREAAKKTKLPNNPVSLVKAYYETDDATRRRLISKRLKTKGVRATRKALVRAFKARQTATGLHLKNIRVHGRVDSYAVYVPRGYKPGRSYPLHISLHGGGGNGPGTCKRRWGADWPRKFILVCPSTPGGRWWSPQGESTVLAVYREVLRDYHVQTDQVSVGGLSNGGTGTFHMATKYPWLWAAVVPRCSARFAFEDWYRNMVNLPTYVIHGGRDHQIVPSNSRWIVDNLHKLGNKASYIEVADGGHDFFSELNPQVVRWMLPKKRKKSINFNYNRVRGPDPDLIYWLAARGAGDIKATMKRKGATTVVHLTTSQKPKSLKVYFPKGFESKNARVLLNGKVVYTGRIQATVHNVLDSFAKTGDLRRVYSGSVDIL